MAETATTATTDTQQAIPRDAVFLPVLGLSGCSCGAGCGCGCQSGGPCQCGGCG